MVEGLWQTPSSSTVCLSSLTSSLLPDRYRRRRWCIHILYCTHIYNTYVIARPVHPGVGPIRTVHSANKFFHCADLKQFTMLVIIFILLHIFFGFPIVYPGWTVWPGPISLPMEKLLHKSKLCITSTLNCEKWLAKNSKWSLEFEYKWLWLGWIWSLFDYILSSSLFFILLFVLCCDLQCILSMLPYF